MSDRLRDDAVVSRHMRLALADALTWSRFPLAVVVSVSAWAEGDVARSLMVPAAVVGAVTDILDGPIARRTGSAGVRGARLDSLADAAFAVALAFALIRTIPTSEWPMWLLAALAVLVVGRLVVGALRRNTGEPWIDHTWPNKVAGAVAFAASLMAFSTGFVKSNPWVMLVAVGALVSAGVALVHDAWRARRTRGAVANTPTR